MKQVATLILAALLPLSAASYNKLDLATGSVTQNSYSKEKPQRDVQYVDDGIVVTYTFSHANLRLDDLYPEATVWEMPGAMLSSNAGEPALPKIGDTFILPAGSSPMVSLVDSDYADFSYTLAPARIQLFENDTIGYNLTNVPPIAPYSGLMPQNICELQSVSKYRSQPVARITVSPVQYDYSAHKVRAYKQLCYKISYNNADPTATVVYEPGSLLNPNHTLSTEGSMFSARDFNPFDSHFADEKYLIISHSDFQESLQPFIKWKKQLGYKVIALYDGNWTPQKIKDAVKSNYGGYPSLTYLLIVGDHSKVPAEEFVTDDWKRKGYVSDMPYACTDGDDDIDPDLYYGRWPMRTAEEVENIVEKTIWYERSPSVEDYYYKTGVHVGFFEDRNEGPYAPNGCKCPDGMEDNRFVKTCEDVRNYMMDRHGFDVQRVYSRDSIYPQERGMTITEPWPNRWSDEHSYGDSIPDELRVENGFGWQTTHDDIIRAIDNRCSYLLFRGHGAPEEWYLSARQQDNWEPRDVFTAEHVKMLNNKNNFPVVFSLTCNTGNHAAPSKENFVRAFLSQKNAGSVGVFAQTSSAMIPDNDILTSALFNCIWPADTVSDALELDKYPINDYLASYREQNKLPVYNLGKIMGYASSIAYSFGTENSLYSKRINHCFADPSLNFNTDVPRSLGHVSVDRDEVNREITVEVENAPAYISFYDPVSDKVERVYTNKYSFYVPHKDYVKYVSVVATDVNTVPFMEFGEEYKGFVSSKSNSHITGWQSIGGSRAWIDYVIAKEDVGKSIRMLVVDTSNNAFIADVPIRDVVAGEKQTVSVFVNSGVMVASLMIDGYPVSNVKMYITQ